jgi:hypothetical protein
MKLKRDLVWCATAGSTRGVVVMHWMGHLRFLAAIVAITGYPHGRRLADRQPIELHEKAEELVPTSHSDSTPSIPALPAEGAPSLEELIHDTNTEQRASQHGVSSSVVDVPPAAEPAFHFHYHG